MARPVRPAPCHPNRPHKARGLCAPCYAVAWAAERGTYRNATMAKCHPDRRHKAKGLCSSCYKAAVLRGEQAVIPRPVDPRMADCHPDRPHAGKGLCRGCYDRQRNRMAMYGLTPERAAELEASESLSGEDRSGSRQRSNISEHVLTWPPNTCKVPLVEPTAAQRPGRQHFDNSIGPRNLGGALASNAYEAPYGR